MRLLAIVMLLGCTRELPRETTEPDADDAAGISAAIRAWEEHPTLPDLSEDAQRYMSRLQVTDAIDAETFGQTCGTCPPLEIDDSPCSRRMRAYACTRHTYDTCLGPIGMFCRSAHLIVISPGFRQSPVRPGLIVHEAIHHLGYATDMGPDAAHADPRRYSEACSDDACRRASVYGRARAILAGAP